MTVVQRQEIPNNTPEQIEAYLRAGMEAVELLEPPPDLRAAVFTEAVRLAASKQVVMVQPQPLDLAGLGLGKLHG